MWWKRCFGNSPRFPPSSQGLRFFGGWEFQKPRSTTTNAEQELRVSSFVLSLSALWHWQEQRVDKELDSCPSCISNQYWFWWRCAICGSPESDGDGVENLPIRGKRKTYSWFNSMSKRSPIWKTNRKISNLPNSSLTNFSLNATRILVNFAQAKGRMNFFCKIFLHILHFFSSLYNS